MKADGSMSADDVGVKHYHYKSCYDYNDFYLHSLGGYDDDFIVSHTIYDPIGGLRRKPYFMIGWGVYVLCNMALAVIRTPNVETLAAFIFLMTMGFVQV